MVTSCYGMFAKVPNDMPSDAWPPPQQQQLDEALYVALRRLKTLSQPKNKRRSPDALRACTHQVIEMSNARAMALMGVEAGEALTLLNVAEPLVVKGSTHAAVTANNLACCYRNLGLSQVPSPRCCCQRLPYPAHPGVLTAAC